MLISNFMTSKAGKKTMLKMPNISRTIGMQSVKFSQLAKHNIRNIFLEKSYAKRGGKISPRPLSKKPKLSISLD